MASSHWYVGPWRWVATEDSAAYEGPEGTRVAIDFRGLPEQGQSGNDMSGVGLFYCPDAESVASEWEPLGQGSWHDIKANGRMRQLFPKRRGVKLDADDLIGLIRQTLMAGDPTGQEFCKPLLPTMDGTLEVTCGKRRHSERFKWGGKETNAIRDVIRNDMEDVIERAGKGKNKKQREHHRRVLDALCEKHGIEDWKEFVKPERVKDIPGRLKHETTITDDFTRADQTGLGTSAGGWSWASVVAGINIVGNRARSTTNNNASRAEFNLSSSDHYAEADVIQSTATLRSMGVRCRYDASADTSYEATSNGWATSSFLIKRVIAGVATTLSTADRGSTVLTRTVRIAVNGSSLELFEDGVSHATATDTNITGNLRCGIGKSGTQQTGTQEWDNFVCSDGGAGGGILYTQLERGIRGVTRGMYTDWRGFR